MRILKIQFELDKEIRQYFNIYIYKVKSYKYKMISILKQIYEKEIKIFYIKQA